MHAKIIYFNSLQKIDEEKLTRKDGEIWENVFRILIGFATDAMLI